MGNVHPLNFPKPVPSHVCEYKALAQRLSNTADWIEGNTARTEGFIAEDAVAVLRWSAGFLLRARTRGQELGDALIAVQCVLKRSIFRQKVAITPLQLAIADPRDHFEMNSASEGKVQKMHDKLEQRIERVSAERAQRMYSGLIALADRTEDMASVPAEPVRALRQLGLALAACAQDEEGRLKQLNLLSAALPILEQIARCLAARYRDEAAVLLRSASELLANDQILERPECGTAD